MGENADKFLNIVSADILNMANWFSSSKFSTVTSTTKI